MANNGDVSNNGGAIDAEDPNGAISLHNVEVIGNSADGNGGGVYSAGSLGVYGVPVESAGLYTSYIEGNTADYSGYASGAGNGGGLYAGGLLTVYQTYVLDNSADNGGGAYAAGNPQAEVYYSVFQDNQATGGDTGTPVTVAASTPGGMPTSSLRHLAALTPMAMQRATRPPAMAPPSIPTRAMSKSTRVPSVAAVPPSLVATPFPSLTRRTSMAALSGPTTTCRWATPKRSAPISSRRTTLKTTAVPFTRSTVSSPSPIPISSAIPQRPAKAVVSGLAATWLSSSSPKSDSLVPTPPTA